MLESTLGKLAAGQDLPEQEMTSAIDAIMSGKCEEGQIGLLLTALNAKGETVGEVVGAARAMRRHMVALHSTRQDVVDTCGTGGDRSGTFNISTAAAIVAAAAGVPVAKHGNRSISSKSGSADVLAELGVLIQVPLATVEHCLDTLGICFCFAPSFHPAMKEVSAIRKKLGVPTIFNLLGPLCNPAESAISAPGRWPTGAATSDRLGPRPAGNRQGGDRLGRGWPGRSHPGGQDKRQHRPGRSGPRDYLVA